MLMSLTIAGRRVRPVALMLLGLLGLSGAATAQTYPNRPISIVVPFQAGSGTDTVARVLAEHMGKELGQPMVVENKAGANGSISATYVARSAPDGYTIFLSTNTPHASAPTLMKSVSYDPIKDFSPITRVGNYTFVLAVHSSVPANNVKELIALAKAEPGKHSFASGNSTGIVSGERFKTLTKTDIFHVPYKSSPGALNDLLGGRVTMMFIDLAPSLSHFEAKSLKALATSRGDRSPLMPQVPTFKEAGVDDMIIESWAALYAPANTPPEIVARLNAEARKVLARADVKEVLAKGGFDTLTSTPEELGEYTKAQLAVWSQMIKDAGIARSEGTQ
jgi:tripartite-type tricarboxylate transporter receptor subunit TctC